MDWAKISTVVGVFLGAAGLALTGVATYYGAMVSADQLQQSQEDAAREKQTQARQVSAWFVSRGNGEVHVLNRSLDTVSIDELALVSHDGAGWFVLPTKGPGIVGPCTEIILEAKAVTVTESVSRNQKKGVVPALTQFMAMAFTDQAGQQWYRSERRFAPRRPGMDDTLDRPGAAYVDRRLLRTKDAKYCGAP